MKYDAQVIGHSHAVVIPPRSRSAPAPAAEPLVPPDELAVTEWLKLRLADLRARSGVGALSVHATWYPHSKEIDARWALHAGGECVIDQPTISAGVKALRQKLAERAATEEAQPCAT